MTARAAKPAAVPPLSPQMQAAIKALARLAVERELRRREIPG